MGRAFLPARKCRYSAGIVGPEVNLLCPFYVSLDNLFRIMYSQLKRRVEREHRE